MSRPSHSSQFYHPNSTGWVVRIIIIIIIIIIITITIIIVIIIMQYFKGAILLQI
jgi:hypothetical protein